MKCSKCGAELKEGQKFCTKCGTPVNVNPNLNTKQTDQPVFCLVCGTPLRPNQKFCTKCGTPAGSSVRPKLEYKPLTEEEMELNREKFIEEPGQKGWFTDGVRAVANAITGGNLNREIAREQEQAVRRQARDDHGQITQAQRDQRAAERAQRAAEDEAERARDRRNQEAIDGVDVVRGRAIWNIQPGQVARLVTEAEFNEVEGLKGVIIQEGCTALVYVDGELVGTLSGGAYTFPKKSEAEKKADREEAERKVQSQEKKDKKTFMDRGLVGTIGIGLNTVRRFFFGNKKGESEQKRQARQQKVDKILKEKTQVKLIRAYLVSDRVLTLTFGGKQNEDGGIDYVPFNVPTKYVDVEIGVSLQMQVMNINDFLRNYLADQSSVTTNQIQQMCMMPVQNAVNQMLRNLDYQQDGLPEPVVANLGNRIQQAINQQLQGIQCTRILQITDRSSDFERFRAVERELYCSEKELGYLQRTGEFRNRLAAETNKQEIDKATSEEELRYALQQINRDQLLHDDEMEQFVLMLNAQKRLREAKSQEEEYEALLDLKKSRLVKEDEMAVLEDALAQNKIQRDSVTEIMRIQHQQSVDDARLKAQWALDDQKQDHDWEREDLQRRRNWGIEDEEREREWMHEEQEYNRQWGRTQQEDEYAWQKRIRETDFEWQQEERRREADWQQRVREHDLGRQDKLDDLQIKLKMQEGSVAALERIEKMKLEKQKEENRSKEAIFSTKATMTGEQLMAEQAAQLSEKGQVAIAEALGSAKEKELLKKQAEEAAERERIQREAAAKDKADIMSFAKEMAGMVKDTAVGVSGAQQAQQQQLTNEYRDQARYAQQRQDHAQDQAFGAMGGVATAAASNLYTNSSQNRVSIDQQYQQQPYQQPVQPQQHAYQQPTTPQPRCPRCGAELSEGDPFCPICGLELEL